MEIDSGIHREKPVGIEHASSGFDVKEEATRTAQRVMREVRSNFTSSISHSLRTPLTAILGFSEALVEDPNIPKEAREEYFAIIRNETERLIQFIALLHDFEALRTGRMILDRTRADLVATVRGAVVAAGSRSTVRAASITVIAQPEEIPFTADHARLGIALEQLFASAATSVPFGHPLFVEVREDSAAAHDF